MSAMARLIPMLILLLPAIAAAQHQATLYYQSTACTTHTPCALQVYRAVCPTPATCPAWQANSALWARVNYGAGSAVPTASGTQWKVIDKDPQLRDSTTYAYCATVSFNSNKKPSACGPVWSGTTGGAGAPATPVVGAGNSVD
jgi:hypothetical protein